MAAALDKRDGAHNRGSISMQDRASTLGNRAIKKRCVTPPVCAGGLTPRPARNHLGPTGAPGRKRFGHIGSIAGARTRTRFPAFMSEQACSRLLVRYVRDRHAKCEWPAQCDSRVGDRRVVSEACMYAGTAGRLESTIPKPNFAPLYVNTRWWRRARSARRCNDTQACRPAKFQTEVQSNFSQKPNFSQKSATGRSVPY